MSSRGPRTYWVSYQFQTPGGAQQGFGAADVQVTGPLSTETITSLGVDLARQVEDRSPLRDVLVVILAFSLIGEG